VLLLLLHPVRAYRPCCRPLLLLLLLLSLVHVQQLAAWRHVADQAHQEQLVLRHRQRIPARIMAEKSAAGLPR
jgi:hypothetical protein